uniref:Microtubule associated scaffold protein 2 n=1 Tax=Sus scrofa TaxID=9823 RepID=A0A8D0NGU9_PIG
MPLLLNFSGRGVVRVGLGGTVFSPQEALGARPPALVPHPQPQCTVHLSACSCPFLDKAPRRGEPGLLGALAPACDAFWWRQWRAPDLKSRRGGWRRRPRGAVCAGGRAGRLACYLQDQVDTLTFQSQSLRDRARRFEEALRRNTEEQLEIALAPYQHLEEDMKSLRQVLEMKNQQIHQQEKKIMELEKLAEKNIILEEKIQVLQQQNEDLKARIDQNTVVTRQLSEENANLQEYVEKETQEKKRLSRTNEELLWKLQTGDPTSPVKLSPTSPIYRGSSSGPSSPARVSMTPR